MKKILAIFLAFICTTSIYATEFNSGGNESEYNAAEAIVTSVTKPEASEISIELDKSVSKVTLTWTTPSSASYYLIYRSTNPDSEYELISTMPSDTHTYMQYLAAGTYYYKIITVLSVMGEEARSDESNIVSVTVEEMLPPNAPVITVEKSEGDSFVISWNMDDLVSGYYVYRATSKNGNYEKIGTVTDTNMYIDTNITKGKTYYYSVIAYNGYGMSEYSDAVSRIIEVEKIKETPTVTISKANNNALVVSWDEVELADGYYVYRATSKSGKYTKLATVTGTSYINKKLTYGKTYYYKVVAYNAYEKTGYSNLVSMKVVPNKVENLKVSTSGSTSLKISWDKLSNTGYALYVSTDNKIWTRVTRTTSCKYTHNSLKSNRTYYYKVRAYHTINGTRVYGAYSDVVETKTAPGKTKLTVTTTSNETLNVNFTEVSGATSYYIYRATSKNGTYKYITQVPKAGTYNDIDVTVGKTYYYKIRVINEEYSFGSYTSYAAKSVVPARVTDFNVISVASTSIKLSWEEVDGNGYEIYRSTNNKKWTKIKTITKDTTETFKNTKLTANKTYYYKIRAYKTVKGKKVYSWFSTVIKTKTAPKTPTITVTTKDYMSLNINVYESKGAVKYEIYRNTSKDGEYELLSKFTKAGTYVDTNLTTGETYYYKVRAINSDGNASLYTSVILKKVVPTTPKISLSTTKKQVKITLNELEGIDGYEIYRATSKRGKYKKIANLSELEFVNSTKKGRKYYYKVRAYKLVGETKIYSSYSSIKYIKSK